MKRFNMLAIASAAAFAMSGAAFAQTNSAAPGQPGSGGNTGSGSPHAKMITDKGYTMSNRMERRGDHTVYWVNKANKPWHVKVYNDGRMTEHEGDFPSTN